MMEHAFAAQTFIGASSVKSCAQVTQRTAKYVAATAPALLSVTMRLVSVKKGGNGPLAFVMKTSLVPAMVSAKQMRAVAAVFLDILRHQTVESAQKGL